ncbi:MAG: M48 family metalloprotease [Myxococcota bacterium]
MSPVRTGCLCAALVALACATAPPLDPAAEGEAVRQQLGVLEEGPVPELVAALGARIAAAVPATPLRFHVVNLPEINAFSLPGGNVYVSRGLLAFVRTESELANVLAHEAAHVVGRHAHRLERERQQIRQALLLRLAAASLRGGPSAVAALELEGAGLVARYTRALEREADLEGQALAARAGFDPSGMASFLSALDRESTFRRGRPRRPSFLDTHPAAPERATDAAMRAASADAGAPRADFVDRLDGLVVGEDPAEGVLRKRWFLHPDLDLALELPADWRVANTAAAVIAAPPAGGALLSLTLQERHGDARAAAIRFLRSGKPALTLLEQGPLDHAAVPAHRAWARVAGPGEPVYTRLYWFAHAGRIYRLQGVVREDGIDRFAADFEATARSFRPLAPAERAGFRIRRLRVVTARSGERFEDVLERGRNVERLDQVALMNGLDVGVVLPVGRRVKVVTEGDYEGAEPER